MAIELIKEIFNYVNVKNIKIENRLALSGGDEKGDYVARNEDEAFIMQFVVDRGGSTDEQRTVNNWSGRKIWTKLLIELGVLQQQFWIDERLLKGDRIDLVRPDPARGDQVDEYNSLFLLGEHFERYLESLTWKDNIGWKLDLWLIEYVKQSVISAKKVDTYGMIYEDMAKMNIMPVSPKRSFEVTVNATLEKDCVYEESFEKEKVSTITDSAKEKVTLTKDFMGWESDKSVVITYQHPEKGSMQSYMGATFLHRETHQKTRLKDGREPPGTGAIVYREQIVNEIRVHDLEIDLSGYKYTDGSGTELEIKLLEAFALVSTQEVCWSETKKENVLYSKEFVVKIETEGNRVIIGDKVRNVVMEQWESRKDDGLELTEGQILVKDIGYIVDVDWQTRLELK